MGGIVGQADQYACFDNTPAPERVARQAPPEEVIREYTRGRRVGDGQNNPRGIRRQHFAGDTPSKGLSHEPYNKDRCDKPGCYSKAVGHHGGEMYCDEHSSSKEASRHFAVDTRGMDPESHAYGRGDNPLFGEFGHEGYDYEGVGRGEFDRRMRGRDPRREELDAREFEDDESGYNWGPEPHHHPFEGDPNSFDTPVYNPRSSPYDTHTGSRHYAEEDPGPWTPAPTWPPPNPKATPGAGGTYDLGGGNPARDPLSSPSMDRFIEQITDPNAGGSWPKPSGPGRERTTNRHGSRLGFNEASRRLADGEGFSDGGDFTSGDFSGDDFGGPTAENLFSYLYRTRPPRAQSQMLGSLDEEEHLSYEDWEQQIRDIYDQQRRKNLRNAEPYVMPPEAHPSQRLNSI